MTRAIVAYKLALLPGSVARPPIAAKLGVMKRPIDPARIELLDPAVVQVLKSKTPTARLAMVFASNRTMRLRLEGHLRTRHPEG